MEDYDIRTEVLAPLREVVREVKGFHPSKVLKEAPSVMKEICKAQSSDFFEDKIKWDVSNSEKTQFYGEWRVRNDKDRMTTVWLRVTAHGYQDPKTKVGNVLIKFFSFLDTHLPVLTPVHLLLYYIYFRTLYVSQLRYYVEESKEWINEIDKRLQAVVTKPVQK